MKEIFNKKLNLRLCVGGGRAAPKKKKNIKIQNLF